MSDEFHCSGSFPVACFEDVQQARSVLLASRALEATALPETVQLKIREVFGAHLGAREVVDRILEAVRRDGDAAVRRFTHAFDGREVTDLLVPGKAIEAALKAVPAEVYTALEAAADRVRVFHERARRSSWIHFEGEGATGQMIRPLARVGIYAPGGRVPYPSSVLMAAVPARVAGVEEIFVASPPGLDGEIAPALLAAAHIAGIKAMYRMGGAQAIGALAFGTPSVPRVDKIVGPGNIFVALAKRAVFGQVAIDGLAGPTECLLVADETANARYLAADLIAQAEHDPLAQPVLLCTSRQQIEKTLIEAELMLRTATRAEIIRQSLAARGAVILVQSVEEGIAFANEYAPEHLCLCVRDAWSKVGLVENAGGVFVGDLSAESIGDYTAGPSHIMPTAGTARFSSPLHVDDFLKITSLFSFGATELQRLGPPAMRIAEAEGLQAHAAAIEVRLSELS